VKTYLCGPINGCTDAEANDWRTLAKSLLTGETVDPMRNDYRGRELEPGIASVIVEADKHDIRECDVLLVNYDKPSVGTSMEVLFAYDLGKRIAVVARKDAMLSPWLVYHMTERFDSFGAACEWINSL
jgi:nucleoside 2-deoxyribosyltransferase